jgi:hypothetical protein
VGTLGAGMHPWSRRSLTVLLALIGLAVLAQLVTAVLRVVIWRTHWQPGLRFFRRYSQIIDNPMTLRSAGRPGERMTAVHHKGRRSGREYVTPVWAERVGQSFYIQLPYGTDVDWCRNVHANHGCTLEHDGVGYDAFAPAIVPAAEAVPLLSAGLRRMQRVAQVESYLRLDTTPRSEAGYESGAHPRSDLHGQLRRSGGTRRSVG